MYYVESAVAKGMKECSGHLVLDQFRTVDTQGFLGVIVTKLGAGAPFVDPVVLPEIDQQRISHCSELIL